MESIGFILREARTRLGLSLEQVNSATRISLKSLRAIESDDLPSIGSPFFYKSFVRQYAAHLKLDYEQLLPTVESVASLMPEPLIPGQGSAPVPSRAIGPPYARSLRWLYSLASLFMVLVGCSLIYAFWQNSRANNHAPLAWAPVRNPSSEARPADSQPQAENTPHGDEDTLGGPVQKDSGAFRIELSAIEPTWLSIIADGTRAFEGILEPDQTKVLEEYETARVRTGNAGGVSCVFNGKPIGTFGPRGQVRTVVFTKDNYQVLQPAVHMALTHFTIYR